MSSILLLSAFLAQAATTGNVEVLTYEQAIKEAHDKSLDLQAAQARLDQSSEISRKAWAAYLPTLTASGAYTRNNAEQSFSLPVGYAVRTNLPPGVADASNASASGSPLPGDPSTTEAVFPNNVVTAVIQPKNMLVGQIQLSQALLVPPLWAAINASYAAQKMAQLTVANMQREILFAVAQLYYGAVGLKQTLAAQQRLLDATRAHERDASTRVNAGAMPRIALIRAEIDRARAEQDVRRAENAFISAKIALGTMLQRQGEFDVEQPGEPTVQGDNKALEDAAMKDRPDVLAAQAGVEFADLSHNGTWLQYLPSIVGNAVYKYANFTGFSNKNYSWAVSAAATWTLWDGGLRESSLRESEAKLVEARATARSAEKKAIDDVRTGLLDLESARANRQKADEQLNLARENMRLVEVNYKSGVATQLDVTDATTQLTTAELGAISERLNSQMAALRLLKAAGTFNP